MYNKYAYEKYDENKFSSEITPFCEDYRVFLSKSKTERHRPQYKKRDRTAKF